MATYPLSNYSSDLVTAVTQGIQSPDALTLTHGLNMGVGVTTMAVSYWPARGKQVFSSFPIHISWDPSI